MIVPDTPNQLVPDRRPSEGRADGPAVQLVGVTRVFGVAPALVRIDLRLERGETLLVRGPNGAGKTTLLKVLATALSPTFGTGSVLGFDLGTVSGRDEIRRRTELLGHRTRLYEDLSARENLRFVSTLFDIETAGISTALERVGLLAAADERVRGFSQGMRQRVALARAVLRRPELLLLDEPYAGLDGAAKEVVDDVILEAATEGRTVVLATHDPSRGSMAGQVVHMDAGRLLSGRAAGSQAGGQAGSQAELAGELVR